MSAITLLKNILLSLLGLIVIWIASVSLPYWIASEIELFPLRLGSLRFVGWIPIIFGASAILWCYWMFNFIGRGTPWPFDPPKKLVVVGLYRYVRNPMEVSFLIILFGEVLLFESSSLILYLVFNYLWMSMRQVLIEEPDLKDRFGEAYVRYRESVPRWIPRFTAYTQDK